MFNSKYLDSKPDISSRMTIMDRYDKFCESQKGKEFLWYSISFTTLIGAIMPIALIAMYYTPYFYQFTVLSMLLFFGNILTVIGQASIKVVISFYLFTVFVNVATAALFYLVS
ncbi:MAG: hypothetical protein GVY26_00255 [Bacteroidetes bacterium]|jgi:hypothetical protein|nr:hypothetical protein [Bacteroidota bacterium]